MGRSVFTAVGAAFVVAFLVLPLLGILFSVSPQAVPWGLLASNLRQAFLSACLSLLLGLPFAYALSKPSPFSFLLRALSLVPLVLPQPAMILSLVVLFGANGIVRLPFSLYGLEGIVLAHALYNFPLAGRIISGSLAANSGYSSVARSLGASKTSAFLKVTLPLLFPALISAFAVAFAFSFTSFAIPLIFGGVSNSTVEVEIFRSLFRDFNSGRAAFLALLQMLVFLPFALAWKAVSWTQPPSIPGKSSAFHHAISMAFVLLMSLVLFGPLLRFSPSQFSLAPLANSFLLAFSSASLSILLWLAVGRRLSGFSFLLFGVSPLVLAVAYYPLVQSVALVVIGHSLLAFPLVSSVLNSSSKAMGKLSAVAASLGASSYQQAVRIILPAFAPAFLTAFLFAFGFSLGEAGFVMSYGGGFSTLSTASVTAFSAYRFSAGYFYVLVLIGFAFAASLLVEKFHVLAGKA
ncbi:MAG: ABC transporter permease subunit [Candidatus Micrarchaeota archaeon]